MTNKDISGDKKPFGPQEAVLITSKLGSGLYDAMACIWQTKVNYDPEMYGISIGKSRATHGNLSNHKYFVINYMPRKYWKYIVQCGSNGALTKRFFVQDKFESFNIKYKLSPKAKLPIVKVAVEWVECELVGKKDFPDHTVFFGKVLNKWVRPGKHRRPYYITRTDVVKGIVV